MYNELNIYNSHLQLVYSIEEIKLLDPLNSLGLSTVHKAFKFSGRFLFFDICFPDNSLESYKTIIFDLKEGKSYITNDVNTELVGFF
ncbi:hypothetical protein EW093_05720 [Thiospirochaeta perfilievii]|uniref:Uncharacterized protein n=1 Tax=Thiospirochaeta perfilievii TaxID=252967 RepID=A0A5C1Q812_9SPIO|nr:hypothetical protein [Thiospirochaeta perfilievii]QEN04223.1 hypothetical protein EW093_05720 [Thiospirochaeta perfilievii]